MKRPRLRCLYATAADPRQTAVGVAELRTGARLRVRFAVRPGPCTGRDCHRRGAYGHRAQRNAAHRPDYLRPGVSAGRAATILTKKPRLPPEKRRRSAQRGSNPTRFGSSRALVNHDGCPGQRRRSAVAGAPSCAWPPGRRFRCAATHLGHGCPSPLPRRPGRTTADRRLGPRRGRDRSATPAVRRHRHRHPCSRPGCRADQSPLKHPEPRLDFDLIGWMLPFFVNLLWQSVLCRRGCEARKTSQATYRLSQRIISGLDSPCAERRAP